MSKPRRSAEHELLDLLVGQAGLAATILDYVIEGRRRDDSWRTMAGELTAKLDRGVSYGWLYTNFRQAPDVLAAEAAFAVELAARFTPAERAQP